MGFDIGKFTSMIFAVIVAIVLIVVVAIPIISENQVASSVTNSGAMNAIINIIPILLVVSVLMAIVGLLVVKRNE